MQQINIIQKITEAENLILDLKPVLEIYGTFEYEIRSFIYAKITLNTVFATLRI